MNLLIVTQKIDTNDDVLGFFHDWVENFAAHYTKVTVICLYKGKYNLPKNVEVLSLGKERMVSKLAYIFNFYRYIWNKKDEYDDVFVHMNPVYVVLGGVFWKMWHKKIGLWYTHKSVDLKLRLAVKLSGIIFSASKESFRLETSKLHVTGHGIDTDYFKPVRADLIQPKHVKLLTVGRISPIKNYETIIRSVSILREIGLEAHLDILGAPIYEHEHTYLGSLKKLVQELGLQESVDFHGSVPHHAILPYLQHADIFINASETGSLDKAVLEAMSAGVVPLTSNEAFIKILGGEAHRSLFEKKDPSSLAQKIKDVCFMPSSDILDYKKKLRDVIVHNHNLKHLITKIVTIYNETGR